MGGDFLNCLNKLYSMSNSLTVMIILCDKEYVERLHRVVSKEDGKIYYSSQIYEVDCGEDEKEIVRVGRQKYVEYRNVLQRHINKFN